MNPHALARKRELIGKIKLALKHLKLEEPVLLAAATENNAALMSFDLTSVMIEIVEHLAAKEEAAEAKREAARAKRVAKKANGTS